MTAQTNQSHSYKEVYSQRESIEILDKYKHELTKDQYEAILSNIGNFAIESMYLNELDIIRNIQIAKGEKTADEIITQQKKEWGLL